MRSVVQLHFRHTLPPLVSPAAMLQHLSFNLHELTDNWTCCPYEGCMVTFRGTEFDRKSNCKRHVRNQHEERETFKCPGDACERIFANHWNLKRHVSTHHPGMTFFSAKSNSTLKLEREVHRNARPIKKAPQEPELQDQLQKYRDILQPNTTSSENTSLQWPRGMIFDGKLIQSCRSSLCSSCFLGNRLC